VVSLLLVDVDNTLIDRTAGFDLWAKAFLREVGKSADSEMSWLRVVDEDGLASRESFFEQVRRRYNLGESTRALVTKYRSEFPRFMPPPADDTLVALQRARRAGLAICIVTNGGRDCRNARSPRPLPQRSMAGLSRSHRRAQVRPTILVAAADRVQRQLTTEAWLIGD
jgi:FMN phosphatase YigB (HAD superfamily)